MPQPTDAPSRRPLLFKEIGELRKQGKTEEALARLRDALRRGELDAEGVERAGRLLLKERQGSPAEPDLRIVVLGQCTTSWLVPSLAAEAWAEGVDAEVADAGYDSILQGLEELTANAQAADVIVMVPWSARLIGGKRPAGDRVEDELSFWRQAWEIVGRRGARLLQVGYDWVVPGPLGYSLAGQAGGPLDLVRQVNASLRRDLPPGAYFLDLDAVSGTVGRSTFYDMRRYYWTKQPFSEAGVRVLAGHLWAGVRALTTGPKKVLVLDLDNTLWGGVVGEAGPQGIALGESADGEAFRAFQAHAKGLADRGIVLAVASKNNPEDAREPFIANSDMILTLDDIGAWEAHWEPKGASLGRIARDLNLGVDSFVFFDDNPAEREQVRQAQPEVAVVDAPADPSEYVRALQSGLWFEAVQLTREDQARSGQYAVERKRRELQQTFTTMDEYLTSLEMVADVREIDETDLGRAVQLLGKTNQFNLTTRRHTRDDLQALLRRERSFGTTLRIADKFGDHGLVGLVIAVPDEDEPETLRIDTWLMSCRVIARTVEQFQFREILRRARASGYRRVLGEYVPTKKNALVAPLYESLGFRAVDAGDAEGPRRFFLEIAAAAEPTTFVRLSS